MKQLFNKSWIAQCPTQNTFNKTIAEKKYKSKPKLHVVAAVMYKVSVSLLINVRLKQWYYTLHCRIVKLREKNYFIGAEQYL